MSATQGSPIALATVKKNVSRYRKENVRSRGNVREMCTTDFRGRIDETNDTLEETAGREKGTTRNTSEGRSPWNHVSEVADTDSNSPTTMINRALSGARTRLPSFPSFDETNTKEILSRPSLRCSAVIVRGARDASRLRLKGR